MDKLESGDKSETKAKCKHCKQVYTAKSLNGTSHLRRHLDKCPAKKNVSIKNFMIGGQINCEGQSMALKHPKIDPEAVRKAICMFVVAGAHSFSIVEEPGFKNMFSTACPNYKFYICNWRNDSTQDEYICITAHWIDNNWKLQKRIIRFGALTPPFDGVSIAEDVSFCLAKWKIDGKVRSFTLDNATYNNTMCSQIKRQLVRNGMELLFGAVLKLIDSVVDKIRAIGRHFRYSIPKKKKFYEIAQQTYHLNPKKRMRGDCCVRWNSTYLMLDRALYFRAAIDHVVEKDSEIKMYLLDDDEWKKVSVIHDFLKFFYDVTNEFSSSNTPTTNIYFKGVWDIQCMLLEAANGSNSFLDAMVKEMQKKFDKYWSDYNLLLSCAYVLDPRFKLKLVEYCYTSLYGKARVKEKVAEVRSTLCNFLKEYRDVDGGGIGDSGKVNGGEPTTLSNGSGRMANFGSWMSSQEQNTADKTQLDLYLEEKNADYNSKLDVLSWWKNNGAPRHPQLAALARDVLAIPISSVPSESAFSMGKKLINPWRGSLTSMTIESLACYEDWLRAKGFSLGGSTIFTLPQDEQDDEDDSKEDEDCQIIE
ncbi:zinc finger BED domain-containing protein RICESLEEPER 2-like [Spinacia oleracea]|uniref:Zinc finger BED domain-containing protein RICESLEEPER 2-like n=1 Tax=Spinacia oleracea TaxID=3562 RepID=A0ABM3QQM6_SPIOL|nr:zinc finger BED domain-containing protein RICESLEEPER 2-like [Spinacia oleracea]